ncbi:hypothetical protein [Actinomadura alba]|uniref:Uncharacterized protein n=1 Tax=Actinomadura alba TaxID=406431 RepID=A0ABR7LN99_9ACTN|nr:hypothetical protein [Actinomadura alba]MBC6466313.1 hypothetical protein [Actinomadura alba]
MPTCAHSRRHREPRATVPFLTTKAFFQLKGPSRAQQGTSPAHRGKPEADPAAAGNHY